MRVQGTIAGAIVEVTVEPYCCYAMKFIGRNNAGDLIGVLGDVIYYESMSSIVTDLRTFADKLESALVEAK